MSKLFEVKEFDSIICNPDYKNDDNYKYLPEKEFVTLIDFIHELAGSDDDQDILNFMSISYKRNLGETITIRNYVGLIQMKNGFQIQVLPKISLSQDDAGNQATKKIFLNMLRSMKDFPSKVFNDASLKIDRMNLYELFINMYLQEVNQLVKKGIKSAYISKDDNLHFYKGKLLVADHIRTNLVHKERFYLSYDEFHPNRPENRLIKSTLLKLQKLTNSFQNSKRIRQLLTSFELVGVSTNYDKDFSRVVIDRNTKDYEMLMAWSNIFLRNKSFSTFSGSTVSRALLFPMESVFESYIAQQMKKTMIPAGWNVSTQDKGYYLFTEPRKQFSLRPDIVMKKNEKVLVLDTKWKNLDTSQNYGIAQSDMYQIYAYSKKYQAQDVWLLYPVNELVRELGPIHFNSGDGTNLKLHFIDLANIDESLQALEEKL